MRSLGLDIGNKRTGVAISDPEGILAFPLTVITNNNEDATIDDIVRLAEEYEIERIVIGLPYSLDGNIGPQAKKVRVFTGKLSLRVDALSQGSDRSEESAKDQPNNLKQIDIQFWDERLSTIAADKLMVEAGMKRNKRKEQRDAMAAAFILQGFLDSRRPEL